LAPQTRHHRFDNPSQIREKYILSVIYHKIKTAEKIQIISIPTTKLGELAAFYLESWRSFTWRVGDNKTT
jgi:hypothetical protein